MKYHTLIFTLLIIAVVTYVTWDTIGMVVAGVDLIEAIGQTHLIRDYDPYRSVFGVYQISILGVGMGLTWLLRKYEILDMVILVHLVGTVVVGMTGNPDMALPFIMLVWAVILKWWYK